MTNDNNHIYKNKGLTNITNIQQVRRNLLVSGCILLSIQAFNFDISGGNFLGLIIEHLNNENVLLIIFLITLYYYINFIAHAYIDIANNKIECTGLIPEIIKEEQIKKGIDRTKNEQLSLGNENDSTIIVWFEQQFEYYLQIVISQNETVKKILEDGEILKTLNSEEGKRLIEKSIINIKSNIKSFSEDTFVKSFHDMMEKAINETAADRRWRSLNNFNEYYESFIKFKNIRAIIFDYLLPYIVGMISTCWFMWGNWYLFPGWIAITVSLIIIFLIPIHKVHKLHNKN